MSSYTTIICYAVDSQLVANLLNQSDSTTLVEALRATGKLTGAAKRKFEEQLAFHLPLIEKIIAGVPAKDQDPFGLEDDDEEMDEEGWEESDEWGGEDDEDDDDDDWDDDDWDDDEPMESEEYLDAFEWLCERLGKSIPVPDSLYAHSIVAYDYYGITDALKQFKSPFPIPILDDAGMLAGFIPRDQLADFKFQPIDPARAAEIQQTLDELESIASLGEDEEDDADEVPGVEASDEDVNEDEDDGGNFFGSFMAEQARRDFAAPSPAEIDRAHAELAAIFADIHRLGKDFIGIVRNVG